MRLSSAITRTLAGLWLILSIPATASNCSKITAFYSVRTVDEAKQEFKRALRAVLGSKGADDTEADIEIFSYSGVYGVKLALRHWEFTTPWAYLLESPKRAYDGNSVAYMRLITEAAVQVLNPEDLGAWSTLRGVPETLSEPILRTRMKYLLDVFRRDGADASFAHLLDTISTWHFTRAEILNDPNEIEDLVDSLIAVSFGGAKIVIQELLSTPHKVALISALHKSLEWELDPESWDYRVELILQLVEQVMAARLQRTEFLEAGVGAMLVEHGMAWGMGRRADFIWPSRIKYAALLERLQAELQK